MCLFIYSICHCPPSDTGLKIDALLGTVNDVLVMAPMEPDQVADKTWQKCCEASALMSEVAAARSQAANMPKRTHE